MAETKSPAIPIKHMDIKLFREQGYLQEVNRRFLHPLGLALETVVGEDGVERLGGIWDYRDDPEGIVYDEPWWSEIKNEAALKHWLVERAWGRKARYRQLRLGYVVQPISRGATPHG